MKARFLSFLQKIGRMQVARPIVNYFFTHAHQLLPVDRLQENENWVAIYHPQPEYPLHILVFPKRSIQSLMDAPSIDAIFFQSLFEIVRELIIEFNLEQRGYRLITNGGPNQTIPQWHWHLISDDVDTEVS